MIKKIIAILIIGGCFAVTTEELTNLRSLIAPGAPTYAAISNLKRLVEKETDRQHKIYLYKIGYHMLFAVNGPTRYVRKYIDNVILLIQ